MKHDKAPNIIPVGKAWDFKEWLSCRPVNLQSWTDQHVYRFSLGTDGHAQLHYKYFCTTPAYMCLDPKCKVAELSWIAHFCEVAWKTGGHEVIGLEAFNTSLGYKTLPRPPPPS